MSINYIHQSAHEVNSNPENVKKKKMFENTRWAKQKPCVKERHTIKLSKRDKKDNQ